MTGFFTSGHAIDVVLAVLLVEALWLWRRGTAVSAIWPALLPAVLMMLALRAALTGYAWPYIAIPLALAFPVHLVDLRRRGLIGKRD
jgi:hypothetical protein